MGVDYYNCHRCDEVYSEHYFRHCSCGEIYCDDCLVELVEKYGIDKENDWVNKCYDCDQEVIKRRHEREVNELNEILNKQIDFPDSERLDILIEELLKHFNE